MASNIRTYTLYLTGLSICLSLAMLGTAARSLHVYYNQRYTNDWFLPLWPGHFDTRELEMLVGTSATVFVLNTVLAVALLAPALPANIMVLGSAILSFAVEVIAIVFSTIMNYRAPTTDTIRTWTCRWSDTYIPFQFGERAPEQFHGLCHKTRFAYFSTIPLLVIQFILVLIAIYAIFARTPSHQQHQDLEKSHGHPLRNMTRAPHVSLESDARSYQDSARILGTKS